MKVPTADPFGEIKMPPLYGSAATVRYTPAEWLAAGKPSRGGSADWDWPTLVEQFEREAEANVGVPLDAVPVSLSTVAWFWQCEHGHRWRETAWSRRGRFSLGPQSNQPRMWQRVAGSKAACPVCVLDQYSPRYEKCGHQARSLELVRRQSYTFPGWCPACMEREPRSGEAVYVDHDLPTSQAEQTLRRRLAALLPVTPSGEANAVVVAPTTWGAKRVFPDILLHTYRVAVEYDSPGPFGEDHGPDGTDREKDAALRAVGWEVVRVRTGGLPAIGPFDVAASGPTQKAAEAVRDMVHRILRERANDEDQEPR